MQPKRVLLVESGQFNGGVIYSLFAREEQFDIIEVSPESPHDLQEAVTQYHPDVIVLDDTHRVEYLIFLLAYMRLDDRIRILVVNANSNHIELYVKEHVPVMKPSDLFAMI